MITMLLFVSHDYVMLYYPHVYVLCSYLGHMWWDAGVFWPIHFALQNWPSLMQTLSIIIRVISSPCSTQGSAKAINTCSSHMMTVSPFSGVAAFIYMELSDVEFIDKGKVDSVLYTHVGSMLNPLIYSLRNQDVKIALKKKTEKNNFWAEIRKC